MSVGEGTKGTIGGIEAVKNMRQWRENFDQRRQEFDREFRQGNRFLNWFLPSIFILAFILTLAVVAAAFWALAVLLPQWMNRP